MFQQLIPEESFVYSLAENQKKQVYHFPHVTIFSPFETKMVDKRLIESTLSSAVDEASSKLLKRFPGDLGELVEQKLTDVVRNLNYNTFRKSVAIFVSPVFEKVLYPDFELEERITVSSHFQISDIIRSRKCTPQFHILVLDEDGGRLLWDDSMSSLYIPNVGSEESELKDRLTRIELLPDKKAQAKTRSDGQFLNRLDEALAGLFETRGLPVFVMGEQDLMNQFRKITRHDGAIAGWVNGHFGGLSMQQLRERLHPYLPDWQFLKQRHLRYLLDAASENNKLITGFREVYENIKNHRGVSLVISKRYLYAKGWKEMNTRLSNRKRLNRFSYLKSVLDELIEKVLENGGDVELADGDILADYDQIALVIR